MKTIVRNEFLYSDFIAVADDKGKRVTYKELAEKAEEFARFTEERSLIFFLCDHQMETVELLYEILYLHRVLLLLSDGSGEEQFQRLFEIYKPQYVYCRKGYGNISEMCHSVLEFEEHILLKTGNEQYPIHPDVAVLLSTSGTTGSPKLVKLSYDNLYHNAEDVCVSLGISCGQKGISPLSMSYVYGLTFAVWHWHCGATLLITEESVLSGQFYEFYKREQANIFAGTPFIYQMLKRIGFWAPKTLEYLYRAVCAGSQLSINEQINLVSLMKEKFWVLYGQTECTGVVAGMHFDEHHIKTGAVGKALTHVEACIDSVENELLIKGHSVCMGYANDREQLAEGDRNHGLLYTGDAAYMDQDGCIYLRGRLSRYVKVLGKRISLDDMERYLSERFADTVFACTGADDAISIFYECFRTGLDREIQYLLDSRIKIPKKFVTCLSIGEIPKNSAGKIMYAELEKRKNERADTQDL